VKTVAALAAIAAMLAGCWPAPGVGPKADAGYQHAAPVIEALNAFYAARHVYPESLRQLVPEFLPDSALQRPPDWNWQRDLRYSGQPNAFELSFWYAGPGSNTCTYTSEAGQWKCGGAI
jgi:hypothetical protein